MSIFGTPVNSLVDSAVSAGVGALQSQAAPSSDATQIVNPGSTPSPWGGNPNTKIGAALSNLPGGGGILTLALLVGGVILLVWVAKKA